MQFNLYYLGEVVPEKNRYRKSGAWNRAKWMVKIIYSIKIFVFRLQFELEETDITNLEHFILFILYLKVRFTSTE